MNNQFRVALLTLSASVAFPVLSPIPASAFTVTVDSVNYDVNIFTGKYNDNPTLFQVPPAGMMPWWGNEQQAYAFAEQVFNNLGSGPTLGYGPIFAYALSGTDISGVSQSLTDLLSQIPETIASDASVNYAIITPLKSPPTSVPAPLPLFGAAAAFGWSRQLRKRII